MWQYFIEDRRGCQEGVGRSQKSLFITCGTRLVPGSYFKDLRQVLGNKKAFLELARTERECQNEVCIIL